MDSQYLTALEETLQQTLSPATVKSAGSKLAKDFYPSPQAIPALVHILQHNTQDQIKQLAAVEARKLILSNWATLADNDKAQIRQSLLQITFTESSKLVRHSSARVVAAIGEFDLENDAWPELLPSLVVAARDANAQNKEMGVFCLSSLLETDSPALIPHQNDFVTLFSTLLTENGSLDVRLNAVQSMDLLAHYIEESDPIDEVSAAKFKGSIPSFVAVLEDAIQNEGASVVKPIFNTMNNLIYMKNSMVGDQLTFLINVMIKLSSNTELDEDIRCMALSFLINAVSARKSKISSNNLGPQLTALATTIASEEVDVDEELNNEDEENINEENTPSTIALRLLSALAGELPPSQVIVPFLENLDSMVRSPNPFARRAGLLCIGVAATGAPDHFSHQLNKIFPVLITCLQDQEIIVQVAAVRCVSSLATELQHHIAEQHEQLLPLIMNIIDSAAHVMSYKYACYALDGIIEFMSFEAIAKYIEPLMQKLFTMLESANSSSLKTAIVSAIGSTAFAGGKSFTPFFEQTIHVLEPFVTNAAETEGMSQDDIELRACAFENISTLARAVGSQTFSSYAPPLVEAAYHTLSAENARVRESGYAFISNMAKVYGKEFAGFLEKLVPLFLKCLEQDEFDFKADDEDEEGEEEEGQDIQDQIKINTGVTNEKEIACVALAELALGTGAAFAPYVEPCFKALAEQVEVSFTIREAALIAVWKIARAMFDATYGPDFKAPKGVPQQSYVDPNVMQLIEQARDLSLLILEEDYDFTLVNCDLESIYEAINSMGPAAIVTDASNTKALETLCVQLMAILKNEHASQVDDETPYETEETSESDAMLFESALEVLISLAIQLGPDFNSIFPPFKDILYESITSKTKNKRVGTVGGLAEICAGLKENNPYAQEFLDLFYDRLANDKSLEVKGNAAYGVGIVIENSTADYSAKYQPILEMLFHLMSKNDEQSKIDDIESKDVVDRCNANACGCVARMALKNEAAIPAVHVVPALLNHLPVESAPEENLPILTWIVQLYGSGNEVIVQQSERVIQILAEVFTKEAERMKLVAESTLGREDVDKLKQFPSDSLKEQVVGLVKFLSEKYPSAVSSHEILKSVIA
ncbi:hypothetical protein PUMCH_001093 [Australozyma saopauloensis]|uniref:Importin N-terminal domain-containing protein n=1 Tax=Australozyma saopauloensis TaxID=291208 RepID=A0AAX4H5P3_9ASCO|nr:hypothetical protein PUMCH_001093 [[Candida] saopauloensis]